MAQKQYETIDTRDFERLVDKVLFNKEYSHVSKAPSQARSTHSKGHSRALSQASGQRRKLYI